MAVTYENIATQTLGNAATTVTFSSIPSTYTDLILIIRGNNTSSGNRAGYIQFNGDTATNYSYTFIQGDGSSAASSRASSQAQAQFSNVLNDNTNSIIQVQNYSNTTTNKTFLARGNSPSTVVQAFVGLWRSTAAINSIAIFLNADQWASGSNFTLYGIKSF